MPTVNQAIFEDRVEAALAAAGFEMVQVRFRDVDGLQYLCFWGQRPKRCLLEVRHVCSDPLTWATVHSMARIFITFYEANVRS